MIGETFSHYRILEKLGQGGMGEVYLAEDTVLYRKVALKFISSNLITDREIKLRFMHEAQAGRGRIKTVDDCPCMQKAVTNLKALDEP